ncbi:hypothetical protein H6G81_35105 [Scytonema hofmannii FACHB-248]|uniref:Uncharacterized protein n=1 Tax=Scytonema hofmannii FACHB-248 TaxID=1842502 RepID=A0ABR8H185_9CYAN|nr:MULTISPECIES: hypothetical protein [Nostocales]MBD2609581.1 hypothetical protein [Scytonema hofmannii FACHB-248]
MTAFTKSQLPDNIDTLEKLIAWAATACYQLNKTATAVEGAGVAQRVAQFGIFNVESNNTNRVILRQSLELEEDFAINGKPIWEEVKELSQQPLPTAFSPLVSVS